MPLFATALVAGCLTACSSDDDDDDNGSGNAAGNMPQGPAATFSGKLLTSVGNTTFEYDDNGRCTRVTESGREVVAIDYSKGTMTLEEFPYPYNVTFDDNGYLTGISININEKFEGATMKVSGIINIEYDGNGHVTKAYTKTSSNVTVPGSESYSENLEGFATWTWDGNLLTNYYDELSGTEDGESYTDKTSCTFSYSDQTNTNCQYTYAIDDAGGMPYKLSYVGMTGKGPDKLISRYTCDGYTDNVSYTLNDDGTIASEKVTSANNGYSNTYSYGYTNYGGARGNICADTRSLTAPASVAKASPVKNPIYGFHSRIKKMLEKAGVKTASQE